MRMRAVCISSILLAVAVLLIPGRASADAVLSVSSVPTVPQGSSFAVDVNISGAVDLYDFQFDLFFDPTVLQATNIVEGAFLSDGGATFFFPGFVDNSTGSITFNADTLETAIPGMNGSGTLIEFDFTAVATGTSFLNLDNIILGDSQGNLLSSSATNSSVTVTTGSTTIPTPEPGTLAFLAAGFLAIAAFSRFRR